MTTAVLISGQARTFRHVYDNLRFYLFSRLENPHFYVSVVDDAQADDMALLCQHFKHVTIEKVAQPHIPEPKAPDNAVSGYANSSPFQSILRQLWHLNRVWGMYPQDCDLVVRCRPDLFFHKLHLPRRMDPVYGQVPYWGGYGGINDRLAFLPGPAAQQYFTTFARLPELLANGVPLHPETLLGTTAGPWVRRTLNAEFSIVRMPDAKGEMTMVRPHHLPGDLVDFLTDAQR